MPLRKIISGGQTGADQAGLWAARALKLEKGGTAPKGWETENGSSEHILKPMGLVEGPSGYKERTKQNVEDSDATVLFGRMTSPGSKLTIRVCKDLGKPHIVNPNPRVLRRFIEINDVETLNVAGNRESKNPGIGTRTYDILVEAFGKR